MRTLALRIGNPATRNPTVRSLHTVRVVVDGQCVGKLQLRGADARKLAAICAAGTRELHITYHVSIPDPDRPACAP